MKHKYNLLADLVHYLVVLGVPTAIWMFSFNIQITALVIQVWIASYVGMIIADKATHKVLEV